MLCSARYNGRTQLSGRTSVSVTKPINSVTKTATELSCQYIVLG